jgi:threonine/homoserine/homoserine lactone efflux protein
VVDGHPFLVASGIGLAGGFVARWITTPRVLGGMNIAAGVLIIGFAGTTAPG